MIAVSWNTDIPLVWKNLTGPSLNSELDIYMWKEILSFNIIRKIESVMCCVMYVLFVYCDVLSEYYYAYDFRTLFILS